MSVSPPTILVIEDDDDIRTTVEVLLRRSGFAPVMAPDGVAGVRMFESRPADLIILDVGLPEQDGWRVLELIRATSRVPVLILTAHGLEADEERALARGANASMSKPFRNDELVSRVRALLPALHA